MQIEKLSELERKLTQLFMVGIPGVVLSTETAALLRHYQPGGIIYFADNYETPALLGELSTELQHLIKKAENMPFFIATDQEGGSVVRLSKPFTHFPDSATIGKLDSPKLTFDIAEVVARELIAVGINLNFWPLCDIHTRPNNPVIGKRAFGTEEELVSRISSAVVRGFVKNGMVSSVKHFPGHGDTTVDSHKSLPKVMMTWQELLEREIKPFAKAIRAKVDVIMVAHILNPNLDPNHPASLSRTTIQEKLRKELRFNRLVFTDDMQMEAITQKYNVEDAVVLAVNAGCDGLIYHQMDQGIEAMETALKALADGKIAVEAVLESHKRITEVKTRVLAHFPPVSMESIGQIVGTEKHANLLQEIKSRIHSIG